MKGDPDAWREKRVYRAVSVIGHCPTKILPIVQEIVLVNLNMFFEIYHYTDLKFHVALCLFCLLFHLLVDDYVLVAKDKHGYNVEQVHSQAVLK